MDESEPVDRPDHRPNSSSDEILEEPSVHMNGDVSNSELAQNDSMLEAQDTHSEEAPDPADESNEQDEEGIPSPEESRERVTRLPLSRIKHMIRTDPDVQLASQDAVFLVAKATVSARKLLNVIVYILKRNRPSFRGAIRSTNSCVCLCLYLHLWMVYAIW